ncbi:MAG TPA: ABC transporter permease [Chitinophagales bacterium]|nr:ABC transporter permease [Chitinophagales bacterium]
MSKISLIIQREYLSRVKKKSFIIMTILGPVLMAGIMIVPIYLALRKHQKQKVEVIDESFLFKGLLPEKESIRFDYPEIPLQTAQETLFDTDYDAILWIPPNILEGKASVVMYYKNQLGVGTEEYIRSILNKMMYDAILAKNKVNIDLIKAAEDGSRFDLITRELERTGNSKKTNSGLQTAIGLGAGVLIYIFILLYGVQVMRGVMEEKTSRIVEVILSSVKPFQLMMGKIIGIAMVGLTQFLLWVVLTASLYTIAGMTILKNVEIEQVQKKEEVLKIGADLNYKKMGKIEDTTKAMKLMNDFKNIDIVQILFCFIFFFLAGYLLYAALFAAMGSAVDSESDTQQFMLPVTLPLIFSFVIAQYVIQNPNSPASMWFSLIPFTSPVVMMVRLPFGVPAWEVILSMCLLVLGFLLTTWLAGRIYRTGILMYGKKVSWRELGKWLFYNG